MAWAISDACSEKSTLSPISIGKFWKCNFNGWFEIGTWNFVCQPFLTIEKICYINMPVRD